MLPPLALLLLLDGHHHVHVQHELMGIATLALQYFARLHARGNATTVLWLLLIFLDDCHSFTVLWLLQIFLEDCHS